MDVLHSVTWIAKRIRTVSTQCHTGTVDTDPTGDFVMAPTHEQELSSSASMLIFAWLSSGCYLAVCYRVTRCL
eukprot:53033-Eustigmatos_ZCMA.PRE.1